VSPEQLPGIQPLVFGELSRHIAFPLLESDRLPDDFLITEDKDGRGLLLFGDRRWDLNITVFKPRAGPRGRCRGSGIFVVSNGAGVASNTVDQLAKRGPVAGMIDLKRDFSAEKILASLRMVRVARPDVDAVALNIISGTALAPHTIEATQAFSHETGGSVTVVLRFNGPGAEEHKSAFEALVSTHPNVAWVNDTSEMVSRTAELLGLEPLRIPVDAEADAEIEAALETRALLGVTQNPAHWLTEPRTIERLFGRCKGTRVGVLGYGRTARFQTLAMEHEGVEIVWMVTPTAAKHAGKRDDGTPSAALFESAASAIAAVGDADIVINYAPADRATEAAVAYIEASGAARLMMLVAENMAFDQVIKAMEALDAAGIALVGPNCPGVMIVEGADGADSAPTRFKLGNMPAHLFGRSGGLSLVGRSGTVLFDMVEKAVAAGFGVRVAWTIGGDRTLGLGFQDALIVLEQDPATEVILLDGEAGGIQEQLAAKLIATGVISKPVVAVVTARTLPAGIQYGHPGSVKFTEADDPAVKERHLREAGCLIVDHPRHMVEILRAIERSGWDLDRRRREATWARIQSGRRRLGRRWPKGQRPLFDAVHALVGDWRLHDAQTRTPGHLADLLMQATRLGIDRFERVIGSIIEPEAFVLAFEKSCEYLAELLRAIVEIGVASMHKLVTEVLTVESFNAALQATPWAAADIVNEASQIGLDETSDVLVRTVGLPAFRSSFANRPWNTAHAFRSINNMRRERFTRAFQRICLHLMGETEFAQVAWQRNAWSAVKLVRGYDRIPDEGLERAVELEETRAAMQAMAANDPAGLLEVGKRAFRASQRDGRPFHASYRELMSQGVAASPTVEGEIERMGDVEFALLRDTALSAEAFQRARRDHERTTARALWMVNELPEWGDTRPPNLSGARWLLRVFQNNADIFDSDAFRTGVGRNPWMALDLLRAVGRMAPADVGRIVDYVVTQSAFDFSMAEHQWGTSQALHKIATMGAQQFFEHHRTLEDAIRDRTAFRAAFKKNPRDAVEIVQALARAGAVGFELLMRAPATRRAFVRRIRLSPRNAAHFLQEVVAIGALAFDDLVDRDLGRSVLNAMLDRRGPALVHTARFIAEVGADAFAAELRAWKAESDDHVLSADNALEVADALRHRILQRRFDGSDTPVRIALPDRAGLELSSRDLRGLYETYPDWADPLLKLHEGEPLQAADRADLYHLVRGRMRFRNHIVPVLANFMPVRDIRATIDRAEPLIPEISRLRGVAQRKGQRFDAYFHTLEVLDQLRAAVLPLTFLEPDLRARVCSVLDASLGRVPRRQLLTLAAALHDLGKADGLEGHVERGLTLAGEVVDRLDLTTNEQALVLDVVRFHSPGKLRRPDETWLAFKSRGGLDLLYDELTGHGSNRYPVETILHYHADILGRQGDRTSEKQVARRREVTQFLLARWTESEPC